MDTNFDQNKNFWKDETSKGMLIWPNEFVIPFVKHNFKVPTSTTILDFGCGMGRDAFALAQDGYKMIAMDFNEENLISIDKRKDDLPISTILNHDIDVPVKNNSVDAIIADGSLFYNSIDITLKILINLRKALKNEGLFWSSFRTDKDSLKSHSTLISKNYYQMDSSTRYFGSTYFFTDENTIRKLYKEAGFTIVELNDFSYTDSNRQNLNSYFHITAKK